LEQKFVTPLKVGLLAVVVSYFLFTLHAMFTLSWIGEWEGLPEPLSTSIFVTDVVAGTFLAFRFVASLIAISAMVLYFAKKGLPASTSNKLLRSVLVFEGLYWLGLLPSGIWGILPSNSGFNTSLLLSTGIPCMVSSIGIPVSLFILAWKLNPYRPPNQAIKWALVAGVLYAFVLWLNNTGMWVITVMGQGFGYLTAYPQYLLSFVLTVFGLLTIALFTVYFAKKSDRRRYSFGFGRVFLVELFDVDLFRRLE
jgi:hypothetical protein